jgi:bacillithiol biosynthesis cysteine-adding enzyme BshC
MLAVTSTLPVRARVLGRPEPPFDRLFDPLAADAVKGGPLAEDLGPPWSDEKALLARASKRAPLHAGLAEALRAYHVRLGASPRSLAAIDRLAAGESTCAIAGQQPAPLGGPLFGLHKVAATVGLARRAALRTHIPCEPVFWNHVEDSDFDEIRSATVGDRTLALHDLALPIAPHPEGGLVGSYPIGPLIELVGNARAHWAGLPGENATQALLDASLARARDLGEAHAALLLALFADVGLVVVDPRLPEFRRAARALIERYLSRAEPLAAAARQAGARLEARLGRRPLADAALESFVFAIEDGRRHKITPAEIAALDSNVPLSPSVALRPVVQDAVLPTVAMACGPGEIAYLAQLREVFEGLDVVPACPVPRFGATWLPPAAVDLLERTSADPWHVVAATDQVLRRHAEGSVPPAMRDSLRGIHDELERRLAAFSNESRMLDASLPQLVESARSKIDYQLGRLMEGLVGKVRHRMEREHPEWPKLRYYLLPGDKLQERRIASLEPVAYRGPQVVTELCDLAEMHAESLERGEHAHFLLEL